MLDPKTLTKRLKTMFGHPFDDFDQRIGESFRNDDVRVLINSHLFCIDNLSKADIRERLAKNGNPVRYEGQHIRGYRYFVYVNEAEGLYSRVFARVNVCDDLVVGSDDETCLVCIRHGRFSLTRQISNDVISVTDDRLLVCL